MPSAPSLSKRSLPKRCRGEPPGWSRTHYSRPVFEDSFDDDGPSRGTAKFLYPHRSNCDRSCRIRRFCVNLRDVLVYQGFVLAFFLRLRDSSHKFKSHLGDVESQREIQMAGFVSFALASDPDQSTNVQHGYTNVLGTPVTPAKLPSDWCNSASP